MAEHRYSWELAEEAIEEYLAATRDCLGHAKPDGGVLGYPAALLLLCIVNALGTYLRMIMSRSTAGTKQSLRVSRFVS
jgi:hypothetical protein